MRTADERIRTVFIASVSSDIGAYLASRFLDEGIKVIGTYRSALPESLADREGLVPYSLDIGDPEAGGRLALRLDEDGVRWDAWISCVGDLRPLGPFLECDFDAWESSIRVNALGQLRLLRALAPLRTTSVEPQVVFFAGGGTMRAVPNFSAYTVSKILLVKMCEQLHAEMADANVFIIGPGWTKTKIHEQVLLPENEKALGDHYRKTEEFMSGAGPVGTSLEDVHSCLRWGMAAGREVVGGRNLSVLHDPWRGEEGARLAERLRGDRNLYRLRRIE